MRVTGLITLFSILSVMVCAEDGAGQTFQGGLRGTVKDVQGVIPGAAVTLTNQDSGVVARNRG